MNGWLWFATITYLLIALVLCVWCFVDDDDDNWDSAVVVGMSIFWPLTLLILVCMIAHEYFTERAS